MDVWIASLEFLILGSESISSLIHSSSVSISFSSHAATTLGGCDEFEKLAHLSGVFELQKFLNSFPTGFVSQKNNPVSLLKREARAG